MDDSRALGDVDLEAFRVEAHRLVDWIARYLAEGRGPSRALAGRPGDVAASLPAVAARRRPSPSTGFLADVERRHRPRPHPLEPSVRSSPTSPTPPRPPAILGEMLSAAFNANAMLWKTSPAATELELVVLDWLRQMLWRSPRASSASSRTRPRPRPWWPWPRRARRCRASTRGAAGLVGQARLRMYASEHAHSSVEKAGIVLGIGQEGFRAIPVDAAFRMDPAALARAIAEDRAAGSPRSPSRRRSGTTSTTSIDPIPAIADVCEREGSGSTWTRPTEAAAAVAPGAPLRARRLSSAPTPSW